MGLTSSLNTALYGLTFNQRQMTVTAANIASADTVGYTTKSVEANVYIDGNGNVSGLLSSDIQRKVDQGIQSSYWNSLADANYSAVMADYTGRTDELLGSLDDATSLPTLMSELNNSLAALVNDPNSYAARLEVISNADTIANKLNDAYSDIQDLRQETDQLIGEQVDDVNSILSSIEQLDDEINKLKAVDGETAALYDQRDLYLEQLSGYLDVTVVQDTSGELRISSHGGQVLYSDGNASTLTYSPTSTLADGTAGNTVQVVSPGGTVSDLLAGSSSGSIVALAELRDETLLEAQAQLDEIASQMSLAFSNVTVDSTATTVGAETGYVLDVSSLQAGNSISLSYTDSSGATQNVNFVAVTDASLLPLSNSDTANADDVVYGIDISSGDPADTVAQIIAALSATDLNVSDDGSGNLQVLGDTATNTTVESLTADVTVTGSSDQGLGLSLFMDASSGLSIYTGALEDGGQKTGFAGSITVNPTLMQDSSQLVVYETTPTENTENDPSRPQYLLDRLSNTKMTFDAGSGIGTTGDPYEGSVIDYVSQVIAYQGNQADSAEVTYEARNSLTTNLAVRYEESYAVDVDSELAFLVQLENSYSANARVMQAVQEMFDVLFNAI